MSVLDPPHGEKFHSSLDNFFERSWCEFRDRWISAKVFMNQQRAPDFYVMQKDLEELWITYAIENTMSREMAESSVKYWTDTLNESKRIVENAMNAYNDYVEHLGNRNFVMDEEKVERLETKFLEAEKSRLECYLMYCATMYASTKFSK